jgi:hypothetical protein
MTLKTRRILYICFIILFLTITPIVFLYASGYGLASGFRIQKTGMFVVDTEPKGARIFLNGKAQREFIKSLYSKNGGYVTTSAKIKNITPGEYDVKIELDGYWPWEKKLNILPGETTYAEDIKLFKKDLPLLLNSFNNGVISMSPDKKRLLNIDKNGVTIFTLNDDKFENYNFSTSTFIKISEASEIMWSPNQEKAIISHYVFDANNLNAPIDLFLKIGQPAKNFKWDSGDSNLVYYEIDNQISELDLDSGANKIIVADCPCGDFLPKNNYINAISENNKLVEFKIADGTIVNEYELPASNYIFINQTSVLLNVFDEKNKILYLADNNSPIKPLTDTINNISISSWVDSSRLLYANDFELWLYDAKNKNKTLYTRISNKINDIIWHPNNNYIFFTTEKDINILELDNREKYNITKILEFDLVRDAYLNENGDYLYFYGRIGSQEGLYKLAI